MKKLYYTTLLGLLIVSFCSCQSTVQNQAQVTQPTPVLDQTVQDNVKRIFDEALRHQESYKLLGRLSKEVGPRLSGSEGADKAVVWCKEVMEGYQFDRVYLQDVMVPHWERGEAEQAVAITPDGKQYPLSVLAIGGSVPTPPAGLRAQVVEVPSYDDIEDFTREQLEGKIVFYNGKWDHTNISTGASYGALVPQRVNGAIKAAEKGALASVISSVGSAYDDNPHTGTGRYNAETDSIPAAALGVISADRLHDLIAEHGTVDLKLTINSKWYPDAPSANVVGELKGSTNPEKIIVMGGHLDSWDVGDGSHDDGAGCMHALGALHLLKKLGIKPKHTIRAVMFMNEENGLRGGTEYAELAKANNETHIIAIESDMGAFTPRGFGFTGDDALLEKLRSFLPYFDSNTVAYIRKGGGGADIGPLHRETQTPMMGLSVDNQKTFDYHHAPSDLYENVNAREMELGTASMAAMIYLIDYFGLQ